MAALVSSGATTVVALMASDAWTQVRDRVAAFFGRGETTAATAELQRSQDDLLAARAEGDEAAASGDIEAAWRSRLRSVLRADPAAADELRRLLDELAPALDGRTVVVHNSVSGGVQHGPVVQGQNFSDLTISSTSSTSSTGTAEDPE
ncbi:hypothetical protein [Actinacidiphila alni]|uniref:hypothetical protein n=1 Tax=Actinacidiphila alni TaxID=380248 RepID=UPI002AFFABBF|nr:hypothetical protein [Actinacidiphila alni]